MSFAAQERGVPWVVVAAEAANPGGKVLIYEAEHSWRQVDGGDREYLEALLVEWRETANQDGDVLLDSLSGLSLGPIRTQRTGHCTREELDILVRNLNKKTG